jgi:hypothetical protein
MMRFVAFRSHLFVNCCCNMCQNLKGLVFILNLWIIQHPVISIRNFSPLGRVYKMWKSVFELRYWRYWMSCDNVYPLGNHFIILNAYLCVEINAHALVMLITKLRDTPQLFKPWLFSSQPCESYFKACHSFTPVGSTQLNFPY